MATLEFDVAAIIMYITPDSCIGLEIHEDPYHILFSS